MAVDPNDREAWIGGGAYALSIEQFQVLYQQFPFDDAVEMAQELVLWNDARRPSRDHYWTWAKAVDEGKAQIRPPVAEAMQKRIDRYMEHLALRTVRGTARASQAFSKLLVKLSQQAEGQEIDKELLEMVAKLSSSYMHANNGTGFVYRELVNGGGSKKNQEPRTFINGNVKVVTNRGQLSKKEKRAVRELRAPIIDAQFSEVP